MRLNKIAHCAIFIAWLLTTFELSASPIDEASNYAVRIKSTIRYAFAEDSAGTSNGAGFLVDKARGWVLTNAHVSGRGTADLEVSFKGHEYFDAKAIYVDPELDFAIVAVEQKNIPDTAKEARLDCSEKSLNGLAVAAYGHPHGLTYSASRGIISQVRYYDGVDWVQTDAAINPGNSGGPLIELDTGEIVGINSMGLKDSEGLNFAVPSKPICKILDLMRDNKNPSPPKLPIGFAVNEESEEYLIVASGSDGKLPEGIKLGDRVTKVNGEAVDTPTKLKTALRGQSGKAKLLLKRGEKDLGAAISIKPEKKILDRRYVLADGAMIAEDVYPERWALERYFHVPSVRSGSYAERSGWKKYRLIMSINGVRPTSIEQIHDLLKGEDKKTMIFRGWSAQDNKCMIFMKWITGLIKLN
ncbi:MAG: S1C family serine protease [Candidatus Puniceispirillaceae bacterium]